MIFLAASVIGIPLLTYYIIRRLRFYEAREANMSNNPLKKSEAKIPDRYRDLNVKKIRFESFQVLYRGFKKDSLWNQMFFVIYMTRIAVPIIVAICCEDHPLVCCLMQLLINLAIINYVFWMDPFTKRVNYYQIMLYEIGVLLMNVCVGLLTIIKETNYYAPLASKALGTTVLAGNGLLNVYPIVFLIIKFFLEVNEIYKELVKQGIQGVRKGIAYLQVLFLYLQAGNMGFEEIITYQPFSQVPKKRPIFSAQTLTEASFLNQESYRGLNTSHREFNMSYTGEQSTIVETRPVREVTRVEEESIIELPTLDSPKIIQKTDPFPEIEPSHPIRAITPESEPEFEYVTRPRQKSLSIESPSKERKSWEEETVPKLQRTGIKHKPIKKQYGGMNFTPLNF